MTGRAARSLPHAPAGLILALLGIVALVAVQQVATVDVTGLLGETLTNASHIPLFAMLTLLLMRVLRKPPWWLLLAAVVAVALVTEALQGLTARNASLLDVGLDLLGALPVIAALETTRRSRRHGRRPWTGFAAWTSAVLLLALMTAAAPARVLLAYAERDRIFPVLLQPPNPSAASGESSMVWALRPLLGGNSAMHIVAAPPDWPGYAGKRVIEVVWADQRYPGISLRGTVPRWERYDALAVDVYLPDGPAMPLTAAVSHVGTGGTAAYLQLMVRRGPQRLRYPLEALLASPGDAPPRIRRLILHTDRAHGSRRLLIGSVRLASAARHDPAFEGTLGATER